jgi:hypothetical protein
MEPDLVGKVGSADLLIAFAVRAVASSANLLERRLAEMAAQGIIGAAGKRQDVVHHVLRAFVAAHRSAKRGHHPDSSIGDGRLDCLGRAAPQPVLVGQIRESAAAAGVRCMTLRAVVKEEFLPDRQRLWVSGKGHHVLRSELFINGPVLRIGLAVLVVKLPELGPTEHPGIAAEAGIGQQISQAEQDGEIEEPGPPAR